jgi:hypothetical protein
MVVAYVMAVGINLSFTGVPYINIPKKNQTIFIGFYSTMANLGALLGAAIGRSFVSSTENLSLTLFGLPFGNKQVLFIMVGFLMLAMSAGIYFLRRNVDDTQ